MNFESSFMNGRKDSKRSKTGGGEVALHWNAGQLRMVVEYTRLCLVGMVVGLLCIVR